MPRPPRPVRRPPIVLLLAIAVGGLGLAGCGPERAAGVPAAIRVEAAVGPLAWLAEEVGGPSVTVDVLAGGGADAHDGELDPRTVARTAGADLVLYVPGLQAAVDDAVAGRPGRFPVGATSAAPTTAHDDHDEHGHDDQDHDHDEAGDLHAWLDPQLMATTARRLGARLARIDPAHAGRYRTNSQRVARRLESLDRRYRRGLATCERRDLVVGHLAFGRLAQRYRLHQVAIAGLDPHREPSGRDLATATRFIERTGTRDVFGEPGASSAVARTVADEAGVRLLLLDPLELGGPDHGGGYLRAMRTNLATLRQGLGCR